MNKEEYLDKLIIKYENKTNPIFIYNENQELVWKKGTKSKSLGEVLELYPIYEYIEKKHWRYLKQGESILIRYIDWSVNVSLEGTPKKFLILEGIRHTALATESASPHVHLTKIFRDTIGTNDLVLTGMKKQMDKGVLPKNHIYLMEKTQYTMLRNIQNLELVGADCQVSGLGKLIKMDMKVYLSELVEEVVQRLGHLDIPFKVQYLENSCYCRIDERRLTMAVLNLIYNSVTYTKENNRVSILMKEVGDKVEILISDRGQGISKSRLQTIFHPFYTDPNQKGTGKGMGIGCYVAKKAIEVNRGTLSITSILGEGTQAKILIPLSKKEDEEELENSGASVLKLRSQYREYKRNKFSDLNIQIGEISEIPPED